MAINVEPDSRTLSSSVAWPWKSRYIEKICLSWFEADWQKQGWMHMLVFALLFEYHTVPCAPCFPCADPGFFVRGPGQSDKKSPDNVVFFLVLSLFYWSQMVNFEENYHFSRFQRGSNIFQGGGGGGGVQLFPGGSNCLYPIETHITCDFPGGSTPWSLSGSALAISTSRR